ncbi:MAG: DoxX family protein, partial [SAR324 cluster bacterium]|nr:DoxX family protein [SAR324 cluster bacterium]
MNGLFTWLDSQKDTGYLILRVVLGIILIIAGYTKLFVFGFDGVAGFFTKIDLFATPLLAYLVPLLEFVGGIAILLGVLTRFLSVWVIVQFGLLTIYVLPMLMDKGWNDIRLELLIVALVILLI